MHFFYISGFAQRFLRNKITYPSLDVKILKTNMKHLGKIKQNTFLRDFNGQTFKHSNKNIIYDI